MNDYNRETLYKQVWEKPVSSVAKEYGVSDTAIAKVCRRLNIPLPPRGYWAKVHAGQAPQIPDLPEYIPPAKATNNQKVEESIPSSMKSNRTIRHSSKFTYHSDTFEEQVNAFLHCCMIEEKDLVYHFKFLISCLDDEEYDNYSSQFKEGKAAFLTACIEKVKSFHLPRLTSPWTCYECEESSSGFRISIHRIDKMHVSNNEIDSSETTELVLLEEMKYNLVSVSEFAALHGIKESTVFQWLSSGKLDSAVYQNDAWLIPEFHQKPDSYEHTLLLWLPPEKPVSIPGFPLVSFCDEIWIKPEEKKYSLEYYNTKDKWKGSRLLSKEEKNYLIVELLKMGISDNCSACRIPIYPRRSDFHLDTEGWACCPSTDDDRY